MIHGGPHGAAGTGVQRQGPGLRGARLGLADGQLPRFHGLRPEFHRRDLRRPGRRRGQGRPLRRGRGASRNIRGSIATRLGVEGGSYGGQLTNWIITQTDRFKAAIPSAGISNLVSYNYMAYYHDYLAVEYGAFPHEQRRHRQALGALGDPLRDKVKTPTMFVHGENDNDVPIAEAEQFYIALKDVGVRDDHDPLPARRPRRAGDGARRRHDQSQHRMVRAPFRSERSTKDRLTCGELL